MIAHPILASEDDEDLVCRTIYNLPDLVDDFFASLQLVYEEGKGGNETRARLTAQHHEITKQTQILAGVPPNSFHLTSNGKVDDEMNQFIEKIVFLWRTELGRANQNGLQWRRPFSRLVSDTSDRLLQTRIRFPLARRVLRQMTSHHSIYTISALVLYGVIVLGVCVAIVVMPSVQVNQVTGASVGAALAALLITMSCIIAYAYYKAMIALDVLFERSFFEKVVNPNAQQATAGEDKPNNPLTVVTQLQQQAAQQQASATVAKNKTKPNVKKHTKAGFYTISYDSDIGYIDGQFIDSQVVMIGFDEEYRVTLWNIAAEVTTGFLETECLGKPLSDLVDTPSGDLRADVMSISKQRGQSIKIRLRAFATAPVTLFTIVAPIHNGDGLMVGSILICANAKDNLKEARAYIHDFQVQEIKSAAQRLIESHTLSHDEESQIVAIHNFSKLGFATESEDLARCMVYEWDWTTGTQLFGKALGTLLSKCTLSMDPNFPPTLCVNPFIPGIIENAVKLSPSRCEVVASVVASVGTAKVYSLYVQINLSSNSRPFDADKTLEALQKTLDVTCGFVRFLDDDTKLEIHFPCQIAMLTEDFGESAASSSTATRQQITFTVNVITLLSNSVDQHNVSMVLLKTMFVSLTNVRDARDLEKKLQSHEVDVIIADRTWLSTAKTLITHTEKVILIPLIPDDQPGAGQTIIEQQAQFVIHSPIQRQALEDLMSDVAIVVNDKKAAMAEQEEREKILTMRQDSPWTQGKLLGRGAFGAVYEAISDLTGGKMAVKMFYFKGESENYINDLLNEIKIMCSLNNLNIVHYFYCERKDNSVNLFMELCDGSLGDYMMSKKRGLTMKVWNILRQVVSAVAYLHGKGIAHRDIKPQNILLKGDTIKLTDFGTSRQTKADEAMQDVQGTFRYMAPEVYRGEAHTLSCDIWSIGCLACELFACPPLFMERRHNTMLGEMKDVELPPQIGGVLRDFVNQCLRMLPEARPSAQMLLLHPLLSECAEVEALPTIFDHKFRHTAGGALKQSAFSLSSFSSDGEK